MSRYGVHIVVSRTPLPTPRRSLADATLYLSDATGNGSLPDAQKILERIVALTAAGETSASIMRRLNPPATLDAVVVEWGAAPT